MVWKFAAGAQCWLEAAWGSQTAVRSGQQAGWNRPLECGSRGTAFVQGLPARHRALLGGWTSWGCSVSEQPAAAAVLPGRESLRVLWSIYTFRFQRSHLDWFKKQVPTPVLAFPAPTRPTHRRVPTLYVPKAGIVQRFVLFSSPDTILWASTGIGLPADIGLPVSPPVLVIILFFRTDRTEVWLCTYWGLPSQGMAFCRFSSALERVQRWWNCRGGFPAWLGACRWKCFVINTASVLGFIC